MVSDPSPRSLSSQEGSRTCAHEPEGGLSPRGPLASRRWVYKRWAHSLLISLLYCLPFIWMAVLALNVAPDDDVPAIQRIVYGVIAAIFLLLIVRTLAIGVYLTDDAIVIRNVLRSRRLRYDEVETFDNGRYRGGSFGVGTVRLRDERSISIFALNPPLGGGFDRQPIIPRLVGELNDQLTARRGALTGGEQGDERVQER